MIPETNFAPRVGWSLPWLLGIGGLVLFLLAGMATWMVGDLRTTKSTIYRLKERTQELQAKVGPKKGLVQDIPDPKRLSALERKIKELDSLVSSPGPSFLEVLVQLEKRISKKVVLKNLRHVRESGEVRLEAITKGHQELTDFLGRLEKMPGFRKARLVRQSRNPGKGEVLFEIRLKGGAG